MRSRKGGLADLKRLRQAAAQTPDPAIGTPRKRQASSATSLLAADPPAVANSPAGEGRAPDAKDALLFNRLIRHTQPIKPQGRLPLPSPPAAPADVLKQRRLAAIGDAPDPIPQVSDLHSPGLSALDDSFYIQTGHGPDLIKKLKRGNWAIGASLDLHGCTLDDARHRLEQFLQSCLDHEIKCVRIVHGKGHGSRHGTPVLRETVRRWLTQLKPVIAYVECNEQDGGAGAVQALLKTG